MKNSKRLILILAMAMIICFLIPVTAFADDIFSTTGTVTPEKEIYYVGDTVEITDYYRNKTGASATSVRVEYYYRLDGANSVYSGSPINFGTVSGGTSESHSFSYTFKESDVGEYRIGSKITYSTSGGGPFNEYSSGHDFIVQLAPTPTPSPEPTPTPTPTPEPTATPTPTPPPVTTAPIETLAPVVTQSAEESGSTAVAENILDTILGDSTMAMVVIIILAIVIILIIVIIILLITKRKK